MESQAIEGLIERLEKAEGPDRALDLEIARLRGVTVMRRTMDGLGNEEFTHWHYTAHVDDALSLVPEGWGVTDVHAWNDGKWSAAVWCFADLRCHKSVCVKPSLALALCIAALKARAAMNSATGSLSAEGRRCATEPDQS